MRRLLIAVVTGCLVIASVFLASPALGAGITIVYPAVGASAPSETLLVSPTVEAVTVSGTFVSPADEMGTIVAYIDGRLDSCDPYFGNDPAAEKTCYLIGAPQGSNWTFQVTRAQVERLGFDYYGKHTVDIVLLDQGMTAVGADTVTFTIVKKAISASASPKPTATPGSARSGGPGDDRGVSGVSSSSGLSSGSAVAPSVLSATPSAQGAELSAAHVAVTALVTIILLLVVGYPGLLLGNTLGDKDNYERIFGRFRRWAAKAKARGGSKGREGAIVRESAKVGESRRAKLPGWARVAIGMSIATVIAGFVDPGFGFNPGSLRLLASVAIAFALQNVLGWWFIRRILRRSDPELEANVEFKAGSLVILAIAVLVSRIVGFEPGMVFGLMVGLSFGATLAKAKQARVTLIGMGYAFGLALIGWAGYSLLAGVHPSGFWLVFLSETLSGLAVSGIASLPVALLPLAVFDGAALFTWKKWVWALCYGIGLFAFLLVLLPLPFSWGDVSTPLVIWVVLYLAYAAVAVGVWAWFRFVRPRRAVPAKEPVSTA